MKVTIQNILIGVLIISVSYLFFLQFNSNKSLKIGYVRSQELVYQFDGMIDAMTKFEEEQKEWTTNVEVLKNDYQGSVDTYNLSRTSLSAQEIAEQEGLLQHQYNNVAKYMQQMESSLAEREAEILEGVLNQVNAFSEEFARLEGLDLVITTALSGTILYGEEKLDYTDELLEYINKKYEGNE